MPSKYLVANDSSNRELICFKSASVLSVKCALYVFYSAYNLPSFRASTQLLSSLSGYAYTKRAWKKDVLELYVDPAFFQMDTSCFQ